MITEIVLVSVLGFLRAVHAERRLYRLYPRLYHEWLELSEHWTPLVRSRVDFCDLKSLARVCLDVPWDKLSIDYAEGYLSFDPMARVFIAHGDNSVRDIRAQVLLHAGVAENADGWASRDMLEDLNGTILDDLAYL